MKSFTKLLIAVFLCLNSLLSVAQQSDTLEMQRTEKGKISFARFKPDANRKIQDGINFLKAVLNAKQDDEFHPIKETIDSLGISHRLYQQYYKGIKVENAEYLIHGKNGSIEIINGDFQDVNISSVIPSVNEQQALTIALTFVNAKKYKWEDANMEKFIKQNTNNLDATYYPKGEIVITKDLLKGGNNLKLAWKFTISSLVPNNEQWIYVDAVTDDVIRETPLIYDVNTPCTAQTRYSGTLGITGDSFAGGFRLRENRNGVDVQTLNLQNSSIYANAIDFTNTNTNFTNGNWANFNQDQAALDAHWGAENVLDYWRIVQNRNSIDGNGIRVLSYVHYTPNGAGWNNAQWVGGTNNHFMQYGDGDGITFNPLTALDICAHEMGHGITEFTAALSPGTQESGALNEGFSDIWGACVENRSAPTKQTWLIGEEIFRGAVFTCIRNLQNPKTTTASEGQHPDTYHGMFWDNNGEPHNNSTVLSHWFFLVSQGGNGTNDIGSVYNVAGIGINNARLIAYRTESVYLTSSANYAAARTASIQAARDLYGTGSCQEIAVTNAWFAVGVGAAYTGNAGLSISGDNIFCTTSTNYTIPNLPLGATVQWSVTPSGIATPATPNATQTTLNKTGDGIITLTAVISNVCGTVVTITKPDITVGKPQPGPITFILIDPALGKIQAQVDPVPNAASYNWYKNGVLQTGHGAAIQFPITRNLCNVYYDISVEAINSCGTSLQTHAEAYVPPCGYAFAVSPNPASASINVAPVAGNAQLSANTTIDEIRVYDLQGNLKKDQKFNKATSASMNIQGLINGSYFVEIISGTIKEKHQLIIQN